MRTGQTGTAAGRSRPARSGERSRRQLPGGRGLRAAGGQLALHSVLLAGALAMLLPFIWMVLISLQSSGTLLAAPAAVWVWPPSLDNYARAWQDIPLARYYANSLFVATTVGAGQVVSGLLAGYVFARLQFRGRDALFLLFLGTLLVPGEVSLIPSFLLLRWLGWIDHYQALIVPFLAHPTAIFLLRQYYLTIPQELEDAARMDGCSRLQSLWYLFVPLALPAAGVVGLFSFLWTWKSFLWPLVVIQSASRYTLPVGLAALQSELGTNWPLLMAATALATLPVLGLYLLTQRHLARDESVLAIGY